MKLLESLIPVFEKMTGIVNDDYFQDGPNGRMETSMDEVNGGMDFTAHSTAGRHPSKVQKIPIFRQPLSKTVSIAVISIKISSRSAGSGLNNPGSSQMDLEFVPTGRYNGIKQ
ncbi:MAG: hypothetical protein IJ106_13530 [Parasporobacterium sp.]|nr:hypothetical protein [Parasporobacterium sp.]